MGHFLKILNIESPYDPAILLLGIYPRELKIYVPTNKNLCMKVCGRTIHS